MPSQTVTPVRESVWSAAPVMQTLEAPLADCDADEVDAYARDCSDDDPDAVARSLPTDIQPSACDDCEPAEPLTFDERCDRVERHVLKQPEHREIRIATLGFCAQRRALPEIEVFIEDLPEYGYDTQNPYRLIRSLEAAGGLVGVELDEEGQVVTPERKEGLSEDEVDDLVFEIDFETTDAGRAVYERLKPSARLDDLLATQTARKDTYCEVLEFCLTPRSRQEIEALLAGREILTLDAPSDQPLQPSVFVDKLERAGVLVWRGKWATSDAGKAYLDEHARVRSVPSIS